MTRYGWSKTSKPPLAADGTRYRAVSFWTGHTLMRYVQHGSQAAWSPQNAMHGHAYDPASAPQKPQQTRRPDPCWLKTLAHRSTYPWQSSRLLIPPLLTVITSATNAFISRMRLQNRQLCKPVKPWGVHLRGPMIQQTRKVRHQRAFEKINPQ